MSNNDGYGQNNGDDQNRQGASSGQHGGYGQQNGFGQQGTSGQNDGYGQQSGAFQSGNVHDAPTQQYSSAGSAGGQHDAQTANGQPQQASSSQAQSPYGQADQYTSQNQYGQSNQYAQQGGYAQQDQYAQSSQYGQQTSYGQSTYGQPQQGVSGYGQSQFGAPTGGVQAQPYASWGKRVGASVIDSLLTLPFAIGAGLAMPSYTVYENAAGSVVATKFVGGSIPVVVLMQLLSFAVIIWNQGYRQGTTGQSIGKKVLGTKLVSEQTGQPVGFGKAVLRQIAHVLDAIPCYVGFLWPLWDAKKQTFADKVTGTVVVDEPKH